jgi:hypothetical protein
MSKVTYRIVRKGKSWAIDHDGQMEGEYATKEGAFEAAVAAGSNSIREGLEVTISVPKRASGEDAFGAELQ